MTQDEKLMQKKRDTVRNLICTAKKHHYVFDKMREETGLGRTAHKLLMDISRIETAKSQTALAEQLEISTPAVAVLLKKLEADGYVLRETSQNDTRYNTIVLTDKGNEIVEKTCKTFFEIDDAVLDGFTTEELDTLNSFFDRLRHNIDVLCEKKRKEDSH